MPAGHAKNADYSLPQITMHLTRCKDQQHPTLEQFYGEIAVSREPVIRKGGAAMLDWFARLKGSPSEKHVYD